MQILDISLNKYSCKIAHIAYITNMLNEHVDLIVLNIYAKTQPTATPTADFIAKLVPESILLPYSA